MLQLALRIPAPAKAGDYREHGSRKTLGIDTLCFLWYSPLIVRACRRAFHWGNLDQCYALQTRGGFMQTVRVLLVDDEPSMRSAIRRLVSGRGPSLAFFEAGDGEEGLRVLEGQQVKGCLLYTSPSPRD